MATFKLIVEYDGSGYHGWQRQPDRPTIQAALEAAILRLTAVETTVVGAGRTDAGVHALGQVAHFASDADFTPAVWTRGLNALLPTDIAVQKAARVRETFHARHGATGKIYRYAIYNHPVRAPLSRRYAWHVFQPLDLGAMRKAARALAGRRDFRSFCAADHEGDNFTVDLKSVVVTKNDAQLWLTFRADRFLKYMVRNLVGFLVEVGRGRRAPDEVAAVLAAQDRRRAGPTAPPHGLTLVRVFYS